MRSDWQEASPHVTSTEADQLVDLWLRQRLAAEQYPAEPGVVTVREVAQALGAREDEVLALLSQIRSKEQAPQPRPAMPIKRSWKMIAAIYAAAGSLLFFIVSIRHPLYGRPTAAYSVQWAGEPAFGASLRTIMPRGFGYNYRGQGAPARYLPPEAALDWAKGEKSILEQINRVNAQGATTYQPLVSPKEIADALARGSRNAEGFYPDSPENRLIEWNSLSLNVDGHELQTDVPMAKVSNEAVEKAVRQYIKGQVEGMLKTLRARLSPTDLPDADGQL